MKPQTENYNIISSDPKMLELFRSVDQVSATDSTVMINGESGTGKELIARAIHYNSAHKGKKPFITVNCGAIPEDLVESELFGHEKGAFTGAIYTRIGRFEQADGGTIFLDEIGDMNPVLQVKFLRVLQEKSFERVGGAEEIKVNIRVIAATNCDLEEAVKKGKFRSDLYYRLNVIPLYLPPLRERKSDIPMLVKNFAEHFNKTKQKNITDIHEETLNCLINYHWPGNIRELENLMERLVVLHNGKGTIYSKDLPEKILGKYSKKEAKVSEIEPFHEENFVAESLVLRDAFRPKFFVGISEEGIDLKKMIENFEKELILEALDETNWVKNRAASLLGLNRTTLVEKIKKLKLEREKI